MSPPRSTPPLLFFFLVLPFGISIGFVSITLPFVLTKAGVAVATTASIVAIGLSANVWRFLWGPVVDLTLSLRRWYLICIAASSVLCALEARKFSGVIPYSWRQVKPLCAGMFALALGYLLKSSFTEAGILLLAPIVAVVYVGTVVAFGLEARDYAVLAQMFPRVEPMMRSFPSGWGGNR